MTGAHCHSVKPAWERGAAMVAMLQGHLPSAEREENGCVDEVKDSTVKRGGSGTESAVSCLSSTHSLYNFSP
jgi:hypothetical protein